MPRFCRLHPPKLQGLVRESVEQAEVREFRITQNLKIIVENP
jgi:hypothetical protein